MVRVTQSVFVSLAYRFWDEAWPLEKNLQVYGARASREGMGGNWRIEIGVDVGDGDPPPAFQEHLDFLKSKLDHRCLWEDQQEFAERASTPERVCRWLAPILFARTLDLGQWAELTVHESERLAFTARVAGPMTADIRINNLTLTCATEWREEEGLALSRDWITQEVRRLLEASREPSGLDTYAWAETLGVRLKTQVPALTRLRIDLGRQKYIVVNP